MGRKKRDWRELICEQLSSGESQVSFCRKRGVSLSSFQYYKSKGAHLEGEEEEFVPLHHEESESRVELSYGDEVRLSFPAGTSAERLSEVVRCLSLK